MPDALNHPNERIKHRLINDSSWPQNYAKIGPGSFR